MGATGLSQEHAGVKLYKFWGSRTVGLRPGMPQNEAAEGGKFFAALYADPLKLEGILKAMTGLSFGAALAIAKRFPWKQYKTFCGCGLCPGRSLGPSRPCASSSHWWGYGPAGCATDL